MSPCGKGHPRYRKPSGKGRCPTCDNAAARARRLAKPKPLRRPMPVRVREGSTRWERTEQLIAQGWALEEIASHLSVRESEIYRVADRMDEAVRG